MMTRRRMAAVTLSFLAFFGIAWRVAKSAAPPENALEEVMKVEEERNQALKTGDAATLERVYSDDLVYANAKGELLTKAQHLAEFKARTLNFLSFEHTNVQASVHGDTGLVTGISKSVVEYQGKVSHNNRRFLNVFSKRDGRWLCVAHIESDIPNKE